MYGNSALTINQWHDVNFCNGTAAAVVENGESSLLNRTARILGQTCSGDDVLDNLNFSSVSLFNCFSYFV